MVTPFSEFAEAKLGRGVKGTYVGVKYTDKSAKAFIEQMKALAVPNVIPIDKVHTTLMYSRVAVPAEIQTDVNYAIPNQKVIPDVFLTSTGKRALVLKLDDSWLPKRHTDLYNENPEATYDYDDYIPHVTASYDIGDWVVPFDEIVLDTPLVISGEYVEELDLDWKA